MTNPGKAITRITFIIDGNGNFITGVKVEFEGGEAGQPSKSPDRPQNPHAFDIAENEYITKVIFFSGTNKWGDNMGSGVQMFTQNGRKMECGRLEGAQHVHTGAQLAGFAGRIGYATDRMSCIWEGKVLQGTNTSFTPYL